MIDYGARGIAHPVLTFPYMARSWVVGIPARFEGGRLVSKLGRPWKRSVVQHILDDPPGEDAHGVLTREGWCLSQIIAQVGINRTSPGDRVEEVEFVELAATIQVVNQESADRLFERSLAVGDYGMVYECQDKTVRRIVETEEFIAVGFEDGDPPHIVLERPNGATFPSEVPPKLQPEVKDWVESDPPIGRWVSVSVDDPTTVFKIHAE